MDDLTYPCRFCGKHVKNSLNFYDFDYAVECEECAKKRVWVTTGFLAGVVFTFLIKLFVNWAVP
jgi:hypothetical protein